MASTIILVSVAINIIGIVLMLTVGLIAVTRHPDKSDPERNTKRYVEPAMLGFLLLVVGILGAVFGAILSVTT